MNALDHDRRKAKRGRKALAAAAVVTLAVTGLVMPAAYAETADKPTLKLTPVDTDIVAVSGRNFPANTKVTIVAVASVGQGSGEIDVNKDGRLLLGFQVPAGFKGKVDVVASQQAAVASIDVDVPADPKLTKTSTGDTKTKRTVTVTKQVATVPGGTALEASLKKLNDNMTAYNAVTDEIEKATTVDATFEAKIVAANESIGATNKKLAELNTSIQKLNSVIEKGSKAEEIKTALTETATLADATVKLSEKALVDINLAKAATVTDGLIDT